MSRLATAVAFFLLAAAQGFAGPVQSFQDLGRRIKVEDQVRIQTAAGSTVAGRVTRLTGTDITIATGAGEMRLAEADIRSVGLRHRSALLGALIGGAAGALALGIPECNGDPNDRCGEGLDVGAVLGAGAGAVAGAFIVRTTTVYRAAGKTVFVAPAFRRHEIGLVAGLRW